MDKTSVFLKTRTNILTDFPTIVGEHNCNCDFSQQMSYYPMLNDQDYFIDCCKTKEEKKISQNIKNSKY